MICCVCGEPFEEDDLVMKVTAHRYKFKRGHRVLIHTSLEDGTSEKLAHLLCPVEQGAPMALIGAERRIY